MIRRFLAVNSPMMGDAKSLDWKGLPALSLGAMRDVDFKLIAQGASTINFLRQLGGAIGVSLVGIVLEWRLAVHHAALAENAGNTADKLRAFYETFLFVAVICASAVLAAWRMQAPADDE